MVILQNSHEAFLWRVMKKTVMANLYSFANAVRHFTVLIYNVKTISQYTARIHKVYVSE